MAGCNSKNGMRSNYLIPIKADGFQPFCQEERFGTAFPNRIKIDLLRIKGLLIPIRLEYLEKVMKKIIIRCYNASLINEEIAKKVSIISK